MSRESIYQNNFKPTYLYIKQHSITGLKYFGKTSTPDPLKYNGSGVYWKQHIKKHGKQHVNTLWYKLFYDKNELIDFALNFSEKENIINSNEWANLTTENGIDGGSHGFASAKYADSGEYVGTLVSVDDSRWVSGEIVGVTHGIHPEIHWGYGKSRSQETRDKISDNHHNVSGINNPRARKIRLISPTGIEIICEGNLKKTCISSGLSYSTMIKLLRENHIPKTGVCVGWKIEYVV